MGQRMRKFSAGGDFTDDSEPGGSTEGMPSFAADDSAAAPPPVKKQSFKEAFAAARANGDKTFEWNGKLYGTQLAKPGAASPAADVRRNAEKDKSPAPLKYQSGAQRLRDAVDAAKTVSADQSPRGARATMKQSDFTGMGSLKFAKGGRIDGIAQRGFTKGKMR